MDPLSISTGCISLISAITKISVEVTSFVRSVRAARRDLDAISRELLSLKTLLELLADDASQNSNNAFLLTLQTQVAGIVSNCTLVLEEIGHVLKKHEGTKFTKAAHWAMSGSQDVQKLRLSLEAHKSALEIALEMVSWSITREIKGDTSKILDESAAIKEDTTQILLEIERLRAQLPEDSRLITPNIILERYLDDMTSYAESVSWLGADAISSINESGERERVERSRSSTPSGSAEAEETESRFPIPPTPAATIVRPTTYTTEDESVTTFQSPESVQLDHQSIPVANIDKPPSQATTTSGSYKFTWQDPYVDEVYVTGTFDNWSKSVKLDKKGTIFEKTVNFTPGKEFAYKFVVDGHWTIDYTKRVEKDKFGNKINLVLSSEITPSAPILDNSLPYVDSTPTPLKSTLDLPETPKQPTLVSPNSLFRLRELIRVKYALDIEIWNLRGTRMKDRPFVEVKMERADAVLSEIITTVQAWEGTEKSWTEDEWEKAKELRRRILSGNKRRWLEHPPWGA